MVDKTLITLLYKSVIEKLLSLCATCLGENISKGDLIKVDRIIKISKRKFTTHTPHLDKVFYKKKTLDKITSISKFVKHQLSRFLNQSKSSRYVGYSHVITKTKRHLR